MNFRATGFLILLALALGLWVWFGEFEGDAGDAGGGPLFPVESDEVSALEVPLKGGGSARLVRGEGDEWSLATPIAFAAAPDVVADLLRGVTGLESVHRLERLEGLDEVEERARFGLAAGARSVRVEAGDEVFVLHMGRATPFGGNLYVSLEGDDAIYTAPEWKLSQFERELRALRDARMLAMAPADVDALRIEIGGKPLAAARRLEDGWVLTEPFPEPADQDRIARMLEDFDLARAVDFVDQPGPLSQYGLDRPEVVVELSHGDERRERIEMGSAGDERFLRVDGSGPIFEIAARIANGVPREIFTLRDKQVLKVDEGEIERVVLIFPRVDERYAFVQRGDEGWKADGHETGVDAARLVDLVYSLSELEAVEIPAPDAKPGALGLEPARVRVELASASGQEIAWLELGDPRPGTGIGARSSQKQRLWIVDETLGADVPLGAEAFRNNWLLRSEDAE